MKSTISLRILFVGMMLILLSPVSAISKYTITGTFDNDSATWDRTKSTPATTTPSCSTESEDSYNNNVSYDQFHIKSSVNTILQAIIAETSIPAIDTMMALYCAPFDPQQPGINLVAMDDDGNGYPNAGLSSRDITLEGGKSYYLVVTNYSNYVLNGTYSLVLGDNTMHIHSLRDVVVVLQILSGLIPPESAMGGLSDIAVDQKITLAQAIVALQEMTN